MFEEEYEIITEYDSNVLSRVAPIKNKEGDYVVQISKIVKDMDLILNSCWVAAEKLGFELVDSKIN